MYKYLHRIAIFAVTFFVLSASSAIAQLPTPTLLCLSVQDDGSILVNWEVEAGTFGFRVFYNPTGTSTSLSVDFLPGASSGFIPVPDAKTKQYNVYMVTYVGTSESSEPSQILRTIEPKIDPQDANNSIAKVEWNPLHNSFNGNYIVYRSTDNLTFKEVGQTSSTNIIDIIDEVCEFAPLYYYVDFMSNGCTSRSMTVESTVEFKDQTDPEDPIFEYVTINEENLAVLHWSHSSSADLAGYQIEVFNVVSGWEIHASLGIQNSFTDEYTNTEFYQDPCDRIVSYVLKAVDKCGRTSAKNVYDEGSIHNTIFLDVDLDANCQRKATLKWNRYNNLQVSSYQIVRSSNDASSIIVGSVDDDGSEEFSFTDDFLIPGEQYTYHISTKSEESDKSSSSCRVDVVADPNLLNAFDLENATVYNNEYIDLFGNGEPADYISEVAIYRSATTPDAFELIMTTPWSSDRMVIPETSAEVYETAYYYQLVALDECGYEMKSSKVMRSIYLELEDLGDGDVRLNWNAFEGWEDELEYDVFRMTDNIVDAGYPQPPTTPGMLIFNDFIDPASTNGRITYFVEASRSNDDVKSRSNDVLFQGEAEVLMPNAFNPDSEVEENRIFTPLVRNVNPANYRFVIYNRWGQMVFETNDPLQGWDGRINGQLSPIGIYAYVVTYADYNGLTFRQRGSVTLLR